MSIEIIFLKWYNWISTTKQRPTTLVEGKKGEKVRLQTPLRKEQKEHGWH